MTQTNEAERLEERAKYAKHIRKARRQRDAYRNWADRLASWIGMQGAKCAPLMAYRQWSGEQSANKREAPSDAANID